MMDRHWIDKFLLIWNRVAMVLLSLHAAQSLWETGVFFFVELPDLETQLAVNKITTAEVNHLIATALILAFTTTINIAMAWRLKDIKERLAHTIDVIAATLLIIGNQVLFEFLANQQLIEIIINLYEK